MIGETLSAKVASARNSIRNAFAAEERTFKTTDDVLREEYHAIWGDDAGDPPLTENAYREKMKIKPQAALCLSGGGIRSAAFSLGVLQVLARERLLTQFHYLSTVSGGGYIGGWLSRWIAEEKQDAAKVERALGESSEILQISSLRANSNFLTPKTGLTSADTWTGILLWMRNVLLNWTVFIPALLFAVLAPNLYLALMTFLAAHPQPLPIWIVKTLLWIASLSLAFAVWQTIRKLPSHRARRGPSGQSIGWFIVLPLLTWAGLMPLLLVAGGHRQTPPQSISMFGVEASILIWLLFFSFAAKIIGYLAAWATNWRNFSLYLKNIVTWVVVVAIATGALWLAITIIDNLATFLPAKDELLGLAGQNVDEDVAATVFMLSILGPLGGTLAHLLLSALYVGFRFADFQDDADREWLARLSAVTVFPTMLWAIFAFVCLFLSFVLLGSNWLRQTAPTWGPTIDRLVKAFGIVSGFVAVLGGKSASAKIDVSNAAPKSGTMMANEILVRTATLFFIAFVFMGLAYIERQAAENLVLTAREHHELGGTARYLLPRILVFLAGFAPLFALWYVLSRKLRRLFWLVGFLALFSFIPYVASGMGRWVIGQADTDGATLIAHFFIASALVLVIFIAAVKIDVNRFSMHGVYRNRLVRGFLGAARTKRGGEDPFTSFDPADNCRISELRAKKGEQSVLYPVINVTLNLVGGENLAWQERKASSFIITPLSCGSAVLGERIDDSGKNIPRRAKGAYVASEEYGGKEHDLEDENKKRRREKAGKETGPDEKKKAVVAPSQEIAPEDKNQPDAGEKKEKTGISLGTAMTISGAAASPSMGYHSAPATAFLMTLFNVRLGAWLANPAAKIGKDEVKAGPTSALKPLLVEALGLTDAKSDNVYLSDGGHFDNLGIYEMVRRRCRYMLVVDADQDEKFAFEDLARAVRFAAIDLDAKIDFTSIKMKNRVEAKEDSATFAVGMITYVEDPDHPGWLIYLKPTYYFENAPVDVRSYGSVNPTFPHDSTLNQWFSESQFESYRRLGEYLMSKLYEDHGPEMTKRAGGATPTLADLFNAVRSSASSAGRAGDWDLCRSG